MQVTVTSERCQGHGRCHTICPSIFDLDDDGYVVLLVEEAPAEIEAEVGRAVASCPEQAISSS